MTANTQDTKTLIATMERQLVPHLYSNGTLRTVRLAYWDYLDHSDAHPSCIMAADHVLSEYMDKTMGAGYSDTLAEAFGSRVSYAYDCYHMLF